LKEKPNYYAIIPADVRYDNELKDKAKLLYGEITSLSDKYGYCYASNKYFAELYGVTVTTISLLIKNLVEKGYIESEIKYKEGSKEILNRYLKIIKGGYLKNFKEGYLKKIKDNNININNTSNNNKYIYMGTYKRIKLTKEQYNKLINDYGENYINKIITRLDEYVESNNNKNKYSNYNLVIRKAIRDNWFKIEKLPSWFNQEAKTQQATIEEQQEMEEMLKKYS
jgi:hypothetical protein